LKENQSTKYEKSSLNNFVIFFWMDFIWKKYRFQECVLNAKPLARITDLKSKNNLESDFQSFNSKSSSFQKNVKNKTQVLLLSKYKIER